ncbi:unnamed protein product [Heligmosomoides polygyrus]|uniref:RxLR effector protein n=1 Tax=Heligmosomoides polygyrus TaxID=6339 RepID=A0A183FJ13_HELPZ|nr:unnamed protein product [Heligmosomoides polygyrus]
MRSLLVFLLLTITYALAYDPVFVDELEGLVINKNDEHELGMLDDDNNMIRVVVERKKLLHQQKLNMRIANATDPKIKEFWEEIRRIDDDMSISENGADLKEFQLKSKLTPIQRLMLGDD